MHEHSGVMIATAPVLSISRGPGWRVQLWNSERWWRGEHGPLVKRKTDRRDSDTMQKGGGGAKEYTVYGSISHAL